MSVVRHGRSAGLGAWTDLVGLSAETLAATYSACADPTDLVAHNWGAEAQAAPLIEAGITGARAASHGGRPGYRPGCLRGRDWRAGTAPGAIPTGSVWFLCRYGSRRHPPPVSARLPKPLVSALLLGFRGVVGCTLVVRQGLRKRVCGLGAGQRGPGWCRHPDQGAL